MMELLYWVYIACGALFILALIMGITLHSTMAADPCDPSYKWFHDKGAENVSIWEALTHGED